MSAKLNGEGSAAGHNKRYPADVQYLMRKLYCKRETLNKEAQSLASLAWEELLTEVIITT